MTHWAAQYIGQAWSRERDCLGWFRIWTREQYKHELALCDIDHESLILSASRVMTSNITELFGYVRTSHPQEGDAVFLSQRCRPHHIGMVVMPGQGLHVLHALEDVGVVLSDQLDLMANGWKLHSYWTRR